MRKIIIVFALLCALAPARAQYESFFGRKSWEYSMAYVPVMYSTEYNPNLLGCISEFYRFYATDTVSLNGYRYYYCIAPNIYNLREDTTKGQLYVYDGITEILLCDMSLNTGDTFILSVPHPSGLEFAWHNISMTVDSITYINGKKNIHLTGDPYYMPTFYGSYNFSMRFMEGIGPMYGINPYNPFALQGLMCLHKDDTLYYMTHPDVGCYQNVVSVPDYPDVFLTVYPNPSDRQVVLSFSTEEEIRGSVLVRDFLGRVCLRTTVTNSTMILNIDNLSPGVYTLTFIDQQNRKITKKIVKK
jgi:hypothetical protein